MRILVRLRCLEGARKTPFATGYRPDWRSRRKPELNGAQVSLPRRVLEVPPDGEAEVLLQPLVPDLWKVEVGDLLSGFEGLKRVVEGVVLEVFEP